MYTYINTRVISGVYATLYRHEGHGYAITDFSGDSKGVTYEFPTRSEAVAFREQLRKKS